MNVLSKELLNYGSIKFDMETKEEDGYRRLRVIRYKRRVYVHHMWNGRIIELFEI